VYAASLAGCIAVVAIRHAALYIVMTLKASRRLQGRQAFDATLNQWWTLFRDWFEIVDIRKLVL
jgi:hypothetical protein